MKYVGVDAHKKYSVLRALDEQGRKTAGSSGRGKPGEWFRNFFADELEEIEQGDRAPLLQ
jgi:hypothetical protein